LVLILVLVFNLNIASQYFNLVIFGECLLIHGNGELKLMLEDMPCWVVVAF